MEEERTHQSMNKEQVNNILKHIDSTQNAAIRKEIFERLGYECFHSRKLKAKVEESSRDVQGFLDRVNVQKNVKYWERLEYNEGKTALILTGVPVDGCACAFADCDQPPLALCNHCCKRFQEEYFGTLLGRKVEVEITETFLFGDMRCNTVIHFVGE